MKIIDQSPFRAEDGSSSLENRLRGIWKHGLSWDRDRKAEDSFIAHLQKGLDNKYTMVRSATLPDLEVPIPLVLAGPPGIYVIVATALKGIYKAKEEVWAVMDANSRRFKPARPNLVKRALLMAKAIENYLSEEFQDLPEVSPVLFLAQPGIHVDAENPAVRLVRVDAADRYVLGLAQSPFALDPTEVKRISDALTRPLPEKEQAGVSILDDTSMATIGSISLQRRQWLLIGLMGIIEIFLLVAFAIVILTLS